MSDFKKLFDEAPHSSVASSVALSVASSEDKNRVGRPATGKRSNVNYERYGVLIQRETAKQVKRFLFDRHERGDEEGDFSDAVDEALKFWLKNGRPSGK